jgi:two-component system, NtrC family, nitrogen regulation sensor histidine kinase NtrY
MLVPFRYRVFLGLLSLGTLPLAVALVVLALQVRSTASPTGPRAALDEVAVTGRALIDALDTASLSAEARNALRTHTNTVARGTSLARRAETLSRTAAGALGLTILGAAAVLVGLSIHLARRWSAMISAPIDELVAWTQRIQRGDPLTETGDTAGAPEFATLRRALVDMSAALELARRQELERERLVAFRETARRVAHEIRGPLTSSALALAQLERTSPSEGEATALEVLRDEHRRLETMAAEFSEFGRLPEGPEAPVDVGELIDDLVESTIPDGVPVELAISGSSHVSGHYEPLRRALRNLVENAIDATDQRGIGIAVEPVTVVTDPGLRIRVWDHGGGVPESRRSQIFEPYYTTKRHGTGLGLALVRQTVEAHRGTITVAHTPGGGATFVIELPDAQWLTDS